MKKTLVMVIAVLFLLVGFNYVNAQNIGGHLTSLSLHVIYQEELIPKDYNKFHVGEKYVTVTPKIDSGTDAVLYIAITGDQGPSEIDFFWNHPKGGKILALHCPFPTIISSHPEIPVTAKTRTDQFQGLATCDFCPDGINLSGPVPVCNSGQPSLTGEPTSIAYLSFKGTVHQDLTVQPKQLTSLSISGTVAGGGFNYLGEADWSSPDCIPNPDDNNTCPSIFTGKFNATLTPCPTNDPQCQNL